MQEGLASTYRRKYERGLDARSIVDVSNHNVRLVSSSHHDSYSDMFGDLCSALGFYSQSSGL
jgi:hypothetical protein